jgi:limonene-1,2-epoxide hydrolase
MTQSDATGPLGTIEGTATSFYVADLDAAIAWYWEELGLTPTTVTASIHRYATFLMGGTVVVLEPNEAALEPVVQRAGSTTMNLIVNGDPADIREELAGRGVSCGPLVQSPNFSAFLIRDPDGNRFCVTRPVTSAARSPRSVAVNFLTWWLDPKPEEFSQFLTDDAIYINGPLGVFRGLNAIRAEREAQLGMERGMGYVALGSDVQSLVVDGGTVMMERVDRFSIGAARSALEVMAAFDVDPDGRIKRWRDSYDLNTVTEQIKAAGVEVNT